MSYLDIFQNDQQQSMAPQPGERHDLPTTFEDNFNAAWSEGQMFGSSLSQFNARGSVINDYADDVRNKTGTDLSEDLAAKEGGVPLDYDAINAKVAALKAKDPSLDIAPLSDDEIDRRAIQKSRAARTGYDAMSQGERTFGGKVGSFLGSAASSTVDPINIVGLAVAPEEGLGILATALRWGGIAATSQAAIEGIGGSYREQVQPGYAESGEPAANILGAAVGGAVLGGTTKALGDAWTRVKTGEWPRSVRDVGNVVESEANIADSNVLPGAEGEAAHRAALGGATDQIVNGEPVNVDQAITPEMQKSLADSAPAPESEAALPAAEPEELNRALPPETVTQTLASPEHIEALRADVDRAILGDKPLTIPVGVDANGEPIHRSVDDMLAEVDGYKEAAAQIQACANPVQEAAE